MITNIFMILLLLGVLQSGAGMAIGGPLSSLICPLSCDFHDPIVDGPTWLYERLATVIRCEKPTVANGTVDNSRCVGGVQYADIDCDIGHEVSNGKGSKTIECDNSTRKWTGLENCTVTVCPNFPLKNTNLTDNALPQTPYGSDQIPVTCDIGYSVRDPNVTTFNAICTKEGEWKGNYHCERDCSSFEYSSTLKMGYKILASKGQDHNGNQQECEDDETTLVQWTTGFQTFWNNTLKAMASDNVYHIGLLRDDDGIWRWTSDNRELYYSEANWCGNADVDSDRKCAFKDKNQDCFDTSLCNAISTSQGPKEDDIAREGYAICEIDCVPVSKIPNK